MTLLHGNVCTFFHMKFFVALLFHGRNHRLIVVACKNGIHAAEKISLHTPKVHFLRTATFDLGPGNHYKLHKSQVKAAQQK